MKIQLRQLKLDDTDHREKETKIERPPARGQPDQEKSVVGLFELREYLRFSKEEKRFSHLALLFVTTADPPINLGGGFFSSLGQEQFGIGVRLRVDVGSPRMHRRGLRSAIRNKILNQCD